MIVPSRATAHVYRIFGALVALLLMMALAVGLMRVRADRAPSSPYGALPAMTSTAAVQAPPAEAVATIAPRVVAAASAPAPERPAAAPTPAPAPAVATAAAVPPAPPSPPVDKAPQADAAPAGSSPRQIALDKAAATSVVPQPAPPAIVAAAALAASAPSVPRAEAGDVQAFADAGPDGPGAMAPAGSMGRSADLSAAAGARININTASVDQLNNIPGGGRIGRTIARHRPYRSLDDLVERRVLKARDFARIRSAITTN